MPADKKASRALKRAWRDALREPDVADDSVVESVQEHVDVLPSDLTLQSNESSTDLTISLEAENVPVAPFVGDLSSIGQSSIVPVASSSHLSVMHLPEDLAVAQLGEGSSIVQEVLFPEMKEGLSPDFSYPDMEMDVSVTPANEILPDPVGTVEDIPWITWPVELDAEAEPDWPLLPDPPHDFTQCEDPCSYSLEDLSVADHHIPEKDAPMYDGAPITPWESLIAILSYAQSEHISGAGLGRLLSLISLHLPSNNNFFQSTNELFSLLSRSDEPVNMFYFCSVCLKERASASDLCDVCNDCEKSVQYFISLPLVPQIKKLYCRPGFSEDIKYKFKRMKKNPNGIEDVYDGLLCKKAEQNLLSNPHNISLMWNTDGLQIFNSSSFSLWPWYFVVNELPPEKRFLSENMLIAGIWGSVSHVHPNIFLSPIYQEVKTLEAGIEVNFYGEKEPYNIHAQVLCGTCDAPACATFMNMKSHSGFYSCPVCSTKGEKCEKTTVFPYEEEVTLRNLDDYSQQVQYAVNNKVLHHPLLLNEKECCGIKGPTLLSYMVPSMFESVAIDSMHCVDLGVMRQMLHLWFDVAMREEKYSVYSKIQTVNARLKQMTPPHFIQRAPQTIDKLVWWKATELENFLFSLSLPVLCDVLEPSYFEHFMLLVQGVALLNTNSVTEEDLEMAGLLLCQFLRQFESLYARRYMSSNLHKLRHLNRSVKNIAPLWASSCYKFEDMNGRLSRLVHGTRHAGLQIQSHLSVITDLPLMVHSLREGAVKLYCEQLSYKWRQLKVSDRISAGTYCVGDFKPLSTDMLEIRDIFGNDFSCVQVFKRLWKSGLLYVSASYGKGIRDSSFVKYTVQNVVKYGCVQVFIKCKRCLCNSATCSCQTLYFAVIKPLDLVIPFQTEVVTVGHIFQCTDSSPDMSLDTVLVTDLQTVMYKIQISNKVYLSEPLNSFELR